MFSSGEHEDRTEGDNGRPASAEHYAIIAGVEFPPRRVAYYEIDGLAIFEGDIILGSAESLRNAVKALPQDRDLKAGHFELPDLIKAVVISGTRYRWPGGRVPILINASVPNQQRVELAIDHWRDVTRLHFLQLTPEDLGNYPNYVEVVRAPDGVCQAAVGMQGGRQTIMIGDDCRRGQVIHEIGHAVGLWHEQSREFREDFVTINWDNIEPGKEANFSQHISDGDNVGDYDYGSIMHYGRYAFSANGLETITPTDPTAVIGQRRALSDRDIQAVHSIYPFTAQVPYVLYSPTELAGQMVRDAGLESDFNGPDGRNSYVISQSPKHGQFVAAGSVVTMGTRKGATP